MPSVLAPDVPKLFHEGKPEVEGWKSVKSEHIGVRFFYMVDDFRGGGPSFRALEKSS